MTPNAQHIAIAEACGWRGLRPNPLNAKQLAGFNDRQGKTEAANGGSPWGVPDYPTDLNAMHDAVDYANANQPDAWNDEYFLKTLCGFTGGFPHRATAAQWAKAFLDTLNLWDDSL